MDDLAVIVVSHNNAQWLRPCLRTIAEHAGAIDLDVVVVDSGSTDGTREVVVREFPEARVVSCANHGFAHANNRALVTCDARYVLFLNPDTEVLEGTFERLVAALDRRPEVGLAGVRQVTADGLLFPTIRRMPNALRALGEALGSERFPFRARWLGERELRLELYETEVACDWTTGAFMIARREALESAGYMDERFFLYSEEPDLCLRLKSAGWQVRHLPHLTILHHADRVPANPSFVAQDVYARLQFARKHFSAPHRAAYRAALCLRWLLRLRRGAAARSALRVLLGRGGPPFGAPPPQAVVAPARR
jgi:N-acetylglucosaminyl-diphospho-decaprenol L-rhamnosyltransferase